MPRLIFKGDTNETFGKFLPTPIIDSIIIENVDPDDPIINPLNEIATEFGQPPVVPEDLTKYSANMSVFFNSDDNFDINPLIEELFDYSTDSSGNNESLYINLYILKNQTNIDELKGDKFALKRLALPVVNADMYQDEATEDSGLTNTDFDIYASLASASNQVISIPFSDFEDKVTFSTDYDEDGNPIMKSSYVTITGYTQAFTSIQDMAIFACVSTESIADLLRYSDATYALNFSDVSYENVIDDNNLAIFSDPVFIDANNQFYPNIPLQALNTKYFKVENFGPTEIINSLNSLTSEYRERALGDSMLSDAIDGIDYVIAMYSNTSEFLPRLNRYKELFPSKSGATTTGRLYERFRIVVTNSNTTLLGQEEVVKRILRNFKLIDARATNFEDISSVSFDETLTDSDFAYPLAIESNVAKYVPESSSKALFPGSTEIDSGELDRLRGEFTNLLERNLRAIRDEGLDFFTGTNPFGRGTLRNSPLVRDAMLKLTDFADAYALSFVDDYNGWRFYIKADDKEEALDIVNSELRYTLDDFTRAIGAGPGEQDWSGIGDLTYEDDELFSYGRTTTGLYSEDFYSEGKGLRHCATHQQIQSLVQNLITGPLTLSVPKRGDGGTDSARLSETFARDDAGVDDYELIVSDITTGFGTGVDVLIDHMQENLAVIDLFHTRTVSYLSETAGVFLVKKSYEEIFGIIIELVTGAISATVDIDDDLGTTVLDNIIHDTVIDSVETLIENHRSAMMDMFEHPSTSPIVGMTRDEKIAWAHEWAKTMRTELEESVTAGIGSRDSLQFYLAQTFREAYEGTTVLCQPQFINYKRGPMTSPTMGVIGGNWPSLQGRISDGTLSVSDQANLSDAILSTFSELADSIEERLTEFMDEALEYFGTEYDAGGLSVLSNIDIVVKKSGFFFYDMEKYMRRGSFISRFVNVDRMLRTMDLAHEMLNNGVQVAEVHSFNLTHKTDIILNSPASANYEKASDPTDFDGMSFECQAGSTGQVYKQVGAIEGGFRYSDFFSTNFLDDSTIETGDYNIEQAAATYGVQRTMSHLVMRNYNFTDFADSALYGEQTWRENYRLLMYYYQMFLDDDKVFLGDLTDTEYSNDRVMLRYEIHDSSFHVLKAIIRKYTMIYEEFIREYVEPASEACAYDEFNMQFNSFFVEGILNKFPDARNQPWYKMVALHVIYVNMFTDIYNGSNSVMLDSANSILDQIKPETGTLEALLNFKEQAERFYEFLQETEESSRILASEICNPSLNIVETHQSGVFDVKSPVVDFIGDFTDAVGTPDGS